MKNILQTTLLSLIIFSSTLVSAPSETKENTHILASYHIINGNAEKEYNELVEKKLKSIGFNLTDPHKRVNDQYKEKWGNTVLDVLSFMPIVRDSTILPLLNIDPRIAGFVPFNIVIHKKKDENVTYIGHLVPEVMLDILDIKNEEVRHKFASTFKALDATIAQQFGGYASKIPYKKLPKKTMINYEFDFETPEDMNNFIARFQNTFELAFIDKGYLITGFHNFMEATDNAEEILSNYDAFWTYSLCHLKFSYNMFDTEGARPEAALFAPCTMYMYIKKNSNKIVIGMYRLHNWSDTLDIKDERRLKLIEQLDTEIPDILSTLGMNPITNENPLLSTNTTSSKIQNVSKEVTIAKTKIIKKVQNKSKEVVTVTKKSKIATPAKNLINHDASVQEIHVGDKIVRIKIPTVPKVKYHGSSSNNLGIHRNITFSKRVPPNYRPHSFDKAKQVKVSTDTRIGEVNKGRISAYLRGAFMTPEDVKTKLKAAGFELISTIPINKNGDLISVVFTDKSLQNMASKPNRGFIASLRVLIDTKDKIISITNPLYMAKGFLQDDFDETSANAILVRLLTQFSDLKNSIDTLKYQLLPKYQFMNGMPHYQDMVEVASGANLLEKIKNNKRVVFIQTLPNGATLVGIKLSKRTRKFTKRIGRNNAGMLPYPILIENGKAKILDPKYYISFMYPKLTMSEFMTIATVPDAMVKDCEKVFK